MKKLLIPALLLATAFLAGCFKDKGNYDYHDINEITISGIRSSYGVLRNVDLLQIEPGLVMTDEGTDPARFQYDWVVMKGTTFLDTLGHDRTLSAVVDLPADSYVLWYRILDKQTRMVWRAKTTLTVGDAFSKGLMLIGEDASGNVEADMLVMVSSDTVLRKNILAQSGLPPLQGPVELMHTSGSELYKRLWLMTRSGSYFLDRSSLKADVNNRFGNLIVTSDNIDKTKLDPIQLAPQLRDSVGNTGSTIYRAVLCSNGLIYAGSPLINGGDYYTNAINRESGDFATTFKAAPFLFYPIQSMSSIVWYDTDNDRFMAYTNWAQSVSAPLTDNSGLFPWDQRAAGRKFVYGENTRNTDGGTSTQTNSFALLKNSSNEYFIYKFFASASPVKRGYYEVKPMAVDFGNADFYAFSSRRSVVFYSIGNKLYAYDYNPGNERFYEMPGFGTDEITMLKFDTQINGPVNSLFVATYNAETGGTLRRYALDLLDPNTVQLIPQSEHVATGLLKVRNMSWRANN
ncbi:MAG: PKD-like family lipoprotein [Candidatus Pseudobacter hemicellulosilyticus]|uniref:PKD-like family lipoprotein n=1 Tax=Candidatus Pseudobacter hemicellulosilyticus TaxID=3121375 RepID=A0AAJ6BFE0_9BACT|nr:MAG: PKD-like family lipoprotein [Pseudobacter sp.]